MVVYSGLHHIISSCRCLLVSQSARRTIDGFHARNHYHCRVRPQASRHEFARGFAAPRVRSRFRRAIANPSQCPSLTPSLVTGRQPSLEPTQHCSALAGSELHSRPASSAKCNESCATEQSVRSRSEGQGSIAIGGVFVRSFVIRGLLVHLRQFAVSLFAVFGFESLFAGFRSVRPSFAIESLFARIGRRSQSNRCSLGSAGFIRIVIR